MLVYARRYVCTLVSTFPRGIKITKGRRELLCDCITGTFSLRCAVLFMNKKENGGEWGRELLEETASIFLFNFQEERAWAGNGRRENAGRKIAGKTFGWNGTYDSRNPFPMIPRWWSARKRNLARTESGSQFSDKCHLARGAPWIS